MIEKKHYFSVLVIEITALALFMFDAINTQTFYWIGFTCISIVIFFAFRGKFPFDNRGRIKSKMAWYGSVLIPMLSASNLGNSNVYPVWYPSHNGVWFFLPYAILGILCVKLDLAIKNSDEQ